MTGSKAPMDSRVTVDGSSSVDGSASVDGSGVVVEEFEVKLASDLEIAGKRWTPRGSSSGSPRRRRRVGLGVHGWCDSAASFDLLAPELVGTGPPMLDEFVAIDLPGHGKSSWRSRDANYAHIDYLYDLQELVTEMGWVVPSPGEEGEGVGEEGVVAPDTDLTVVGHSMGASVSMLFAGSWPQALDSLVLVEGLGPFSFRDEEAADVSRSFLASRTKYLKGYSAPRVYDSLDEMVDRLSMSLVQSGDMDPIPKPAAEILVARAAISSPDGSGFMWRSDPRLRMSAPWRFSETAVTSFLTSVQVPTLVIRGDRGWPFPSEIAESRLASLARVVDVHLPGSHHLHLEIAPQIAHDHILPHIAPPH